MELPILSIECFVSTAASASDVDSANSIQRFELVKSSQVDEAVCRPFWSDVRMAESPGSLAARWAASGLEMDDELTGEPSEAGVDGEGLSAPVPGDEHDATMSDMGAEAEALARDAECEQQREVLVECVVCVGDDAGGCGSEARRGHEGEGGVGGCVGADGVELRATRAAHEAEGDDGDEIMEGDENCSLQHAEGGSGLNGGIKKGKRRRRAKGAASQVQRQVAARRDRSEHARQLSPALPSGV
jgi:hypothetical protein